jgi:hypothetical protein
VVGPLAELIHQIATFTRKSPIGSHGHLVRYAVHNFTNRDNLNKLKENRHSSPSNPWTRKIQSAQEK